VQGALGIVVFGTVIVAALIGVFSLVHRGDLYDQIGQGGLSLRDGRDRGADPAPSSAAGLAVRDEEIRQMLEAQNARRIRRGQAPVDVETELARLVAPPAATGDPALREEVRQLVHARNARRARQGKEPLDVEAEIDRQLADLS
jgi:hypothetical protein